MKTKQIKEHLTFNFKERLAFIILLLIIAVIFAYPFLLNKKDDQPLTIIKSSNSTEKKNEISNERREDNYNQKIYANNEKKNSIKLFPFDPNTASIEDWQSIGLRDRTIKTIKNYLSKGGQFRKKEDLKRIYGLHEDEYNRLEPYISIASTEKTNSYKSNNSYPSNKKEEPPRPVKETKNLTIDDINTADANAFIALPGIGDKLATRVINFRNKLGGFYSIEQIRETYGLPDSTFQIIKQYFKLTSGVKKININTASKDDLKSHPYFKWNIANAIVEYRNQHGNYKALEELKNIVVIDEAGYRKMLPYLTL